MSEAFKSISKGLKEAIEYSKGKKKKPENLKSSDMKKEKKVQKVKNIPKFKNEEEEKEFWAKNDSTDYVDWSKAKKVQFPSLKPSIL